MLFVVLSAAKSRPHLFWKKWVLVWGIPQNVRLFICQLPLWTKCESDWEGRKFVPFLLASVSLTSISAMTGKVAVKYDHVAPDFSVWVFYIIVVFWVRSAQFVLPEKHLTVTSGIRFGVGSATAIKNRKFIVFAATREEKLKMLLSANFWNLNTFFFISKRENWFKAQARIQDFGQGGASRVLTPKGALKPKFAENRGFPLKLPENCMILKKYWGQGGPLDPLLKHSTHLLILSSSIGNQHVDQSRRKCIRSLSQIDLAYDVHLNINQPFSQYTIR